MRILRYIQRDGVGVFDDLRGRIRAASLQWSVYGSARGFQVPTDKIASVFMLQEQPMAIRPNEALAAPTMMT